MTPLFVLVNRAQGRDFAPTAVVRYGWARTIGAPVDVIADVPAHELATLARDHDRTWPWGVLDVQTIYHGGRHMVVWDEESQSWCIAGVRKVKTITLTDLVSLEAVDAVTTTPCILETDVSGVTSSHYYGERESLSPGLAITILYWKRYCPKLRAYVLTGDVHEELGPVWRLAELGDSRAKR